MPVAFLALAQQCAPQIATETLAAVVSVESGFQPFAIRINSDHPLNEPPKTRAEAIETATILIADGHDIDLGLGGINSGDLGQLGLSISDSFDFCLNLKATASLLEGYYKIALRDGATASQAETIMFRSYYGHGDTSVGEMVGYDNKVLIERDHIERRLKNIEIAEGSENISPSLERAEKSVTHSADAVKQASERDRTQAPTPQWDAFNSRRRSSVLVFSNAQKD